MIKQRPGCIGAFVGAVVGIACLYYFPEPIQSFGRYIPDADGRIDDLVLSIGSFLVCVWLGYVVGMLGALMSRTNVNLIFWGSIAAVVFVGAVFAYLYEFTFAQGAIFTAAIFLFTCWVCVATGSSFGPLTENRAVGLIVTVGFVIALFMCFTE